MSTPDSVGPVCSSCATVNRAGAKFCRSCGAALSTATAATVPGADSTESPRRSGAVRSWAGRHKLLIGALGVGLVVAGLGGFYGVQATSGDDTDPTGPVSTYFAALQNRDPAGVALALGTGSPFAQPGALADGYTPPTGLQIKDVSYGAPSDETKRPNKGVANVRVVYRLDGVDGEVTSTLRLQRDNDGVLRPWRISAGAAGHLDVISTQVTTARLGGARVTTMSTARIGGGSGGSGIDAPPGVYRVQAAADDSLFAAVESTVAVTASLHSGEPTQVKLRLQVKDSLRVEIAQQVRARIEVCAAQKTITPKNCPFGLDEFVIPEPSDAVWTIQTWPEIELVPAERPSSDGGPILVKSKVKGRANVAYSHNAEQRTAAVDIKPQGPVVVKDGRPTWG